MQHVPHVSHPTPTLCLASPLSPSHRSTLGCPPSIRSSCPAPKPTIPRCPHTALGLPAASVAACPLWLPLPSSAAAAGSCHPSSTAALHIAPHPWLAQGNGPPLRYIRSAGAPLPAATLHALETNFGAPVLEGFAVRCSWMPGLPARAAEHGLARQPHRAPCRLRIGRREGVSARVLPRPPRRPPVCPAPPLRR